MISAFPIVTRSNASVFTIWLAIGPPSKLSATRRPSGDAFRYSPSRRSVKNPLRVVPTTTRPSPSRAMKVRQASYSRVVGVRTSPASSSSSGYDTIACGNGAIAGSTSFPFRSRIATPFATPSPATKPPWSDV